MELTQRAGRLTQTQFWKGRVIYKDVDRSQGIDGFWATALDSECSPMSLSVVDFGTRFLLTTWS